MLLNAVVGNDDDDGDDDDVDADSDTDNITSRQRRRRKESKSLSPRSRSRKNEEEQDALLTGAAAATEEFDAIVGDDGVGDSATTLSFHDRQVKISRTCARDVLHRFGEVASLSN